MGQIHCKYKVIYIENTSLIAVFSAIRITKMKEGREERLKSHPVKCKLIAVMPDGEIFLKGQ